MTYINIAAVILWSQMKLEIVHGMFVWCCMRSNYGFLISTDELEKQNKTKQNKKKTVGSGQYVFNNFVVPDLC